MSHRGVRYSVFVSCLLAGLVCLVFPDRAYAPSTQSVQGRPLENWTAQLQNGTEAERVTAILAMKKFGPRAVPAFAKALVGDPSPRVREEAAIALRHTRQSMGARAMPMLNQALNDPDPNVRRAAAVTLAREGVDVRLQAADLREEEPPHAVRNQPEDVPALQDALTDSDSRIRKVAAQSLGRIGPAARLAAPELALALQDPAAEVRDAASDALERLGPDAVLALMGALKSHRPDVRETAAWALGLLGPAARDAVAELRALSANDPSPHVSRAAAVALAKIQPR